jgi:large subunit ribosomal protein L13
VKTYVPQQSDVDRKWYVVDVGGKILGRQAVKVARILMGKTKPVYTPFLDLGDFVIVINADKVRLSGKKEGMKKYYRYSGYPGGLKEVPFSRYINQRPEELFRKAVWGMLPKGPLGRKMIKKLKVYRGSGHPHKAQRPEPLDLN